MAIDWGTTFSSMAYAYQQDGEVHEVSTWYVQFFEDEHNWAELNFSVRTGTVTRDLNLHVTYRLLSTGNHWVLVVNFEYAHG